MVERDECDGHDATIVDIAPAPKTMTVVQADVCLPTILFEKPSMAFLLALFVISLAADRHCHRSRHIPRQFSRKHE